jgi:uncharacterized membrane protein YbhN (UPF0104 family)
MAHPQSQSSFLPRPATILKALVFLVLAFLILRNADLGRVAAHLQRIPAATYLLAFAALVTSVAIQALRWKLLLEDPDIPYWECYAFVGIGSSLAMASPSSLLADGAVGYWLGKRQHGVLRALSSLLAARVFGGVAAVLLFFAALPSHLWVFRELRLESASRQAMAAAILAVVLVAGAVFARLYRDKFAQLLDRALPILRKPRALAIALSLSLAVQLVQISVHWLAFRAIGAPIAFVDLLFFLPLIAMLGILPISLGGMGVREGLAIVFFTLLPGVGKEMVLAEAGFRYLLMASMAAVNLGVAGVILRRAAPRQVVRGTG